MHHLTTYDGLDSLGLVLRLDQYNEPALSNSRSDAPWQILLLVTVSASEMKINFCNVEVTVLQDHRSIGCGRICITGYDPPYACACFRLYEPLRDASQSLTERPRVNFFTTWSGTRRHFSR